MKELTPKKIVRELDKYIIGQTQAKKSVAIALRNRWRRQQVDPEIARRVRAVEKDIKNGKIKVPYLGKKMIK